MSILLAMQGALSQGILWGLMALGVYITFRLLDIADLTVDGSFATGGAVCAVCLVNGVDPVLSFDFKYDCRIYRRLCDRLFTYKMSDSGYFGRNTYANWFIFDQLTNHGALQHAVTSI